MVLSVSRRIALPLLWMIVALTGTVLDSLASGLVIAPTRVIFEGRSRVATVYLTNRSDATTTYRISLRDKRMLESGQIVDAAEPTRHERPASGLIRYSPRRVDLPPGGSQTIRLMLTAGGDDPLQRGEYRTHLVFTSTPPPAPSDDGQVRARAILETSIPVIVRRDDPDAAVSFAGAAMDTALSRDGRPQLNVTLAREGLRSVYGDLTVEWFENGRPALLAKLAGLGVYHPTPRRIMTIPLNVDPDAVLDHGELVIRFQETELGRGDLFTETTINLSPEAEQE